MQYFKNKKKAGLSKKGHGKGPIEKRKRQRKEEFITAFDDDGQNEGIDKSSIPKISIQPKLKLEFGDEEGAEDLKDVNEWKKKKGNSGFQVFGLSPPILKAVMKRGYKVPTPIQRKTIPLIMEGKDVVGMARTGSGKTAAFLLPLLEKLMISKCRVGQEIKYPRGLILSPTRELATQTVKFFRELGKFVDLKVVSILGGDSMESQFSALHDKPDVVIATPGRFMHLCVEMELRLDGVEYVVFDEADRLFEMGFGEQLTEILSRLSGNRQTILFSATLPRVLVDFTKAGLHNPTLIRLDVDSKLPETLKLSYVACRSEDKIATLLYLLKNEIYERDQTIVFVATKHHVEYLHAILDIANISNSYIYSSLDASARKISLGKFRNGITNVLIVTDIAARGIDIPILDNVINFHFPSKPKLFMHRVGRVARAGRTGTAYSIICPDEIAFLFDLHLFLGRPLKFILEDDSDKSKEYAFVGKIPQDLLDEEHTFLRNIMETKTDLVTMSKVCKNGYGQYLKSRPNASTESNKRAKDIIVSNLQFHPMFGKRFKEDPMNSLINQMQTYRPRSTIFEIGPKAGSETFRIMQQKRTRDQTAVEKYRNIKQVSSHNMDENSDIPKVSAGTKDEEHFISYLPKDHHTEAGLSVGTTSFERQMQESVLDLTVDDSTILKTQSSHMKWDRKRKKFIHAGNDDKKGKKIKTESGRWISASYKSDRYNTWKEKSKVESVREVEESDDETDNGGIEKSTRKRVPKMERSGPPQNPSVPFQKGKRFRSEIKRPEEILKNRKQKEMNERKQKGGKGKKKKNHRSGSGGSSSSFGRGGRGGSRGGSQSRGGGAGGRRGRK